MSFSAAGKTHVTSVLRSREEIRVQECDPLERAHARAHRVRRHAGSSLEQLEHICRNYWPEARRSIWNKNSNLASYLGWSSEATAERLCSGTPASVPPASPRFPWSVLRIAQEPLVVSGISTSLTVSA